MTPLDILGPDAQPCRKERIMTTNAQRITAWRVAHPHEQLTADALIDLWGADLRGADLRGAYLRGADLYGADLRGADLHGADLRGADLRGAYLYGADLRGADLHGADHEHIMPINAGASGQGALYPQADGWKISIGCWKHYTLDELDNLLADRTEWPEATGAERERRRPLLSAIRATCDAFIAQMPADLIDRHAAARAEVAS